MTGAEVYSYILRKFKRTDKSTEVYEAMTDVIADMRLRFLSDDFKEEAYITGITVLGDYRLAVPSDFGHLIGNVSITDTASDSEYAPLIKISKEKYDELYADRLLTAVGNMNKSTPRHFCVYGDQILLGPVPDLLTYRYQINYTTEGFTEVSASTDPVPFCGNYRNTVRAGVLAELHDGLENYEESNFWRVVYNDGLEKIITNDYNNVDDEQRVEYSSV